MNTPAASVAMNGLFQPGFTSNEKVVIDIMAQKPTTGVYPPGTAPAIDVYDGRALQESESDGLDDFHSRFFKKHGFVMLEHESSVENWDSGALPQSDAIDSIGNRKVDAHFDENEIETRYMAEVDHIIRNQILPGESLEIQQPNMLLRRGPNTANPFFGLVVHNDYGLTADDFEENSAAFGSVDGAQAWRKNYDRPNVRGFMVINFWRTVHMQQPLQHMPLAVLDASSVEREDAISSGLKGFAPTGRITNQLSLRFNPEQRWYYYPRVTTSEVIVLKLFECHKGDRNNLIYNSYHSAFDEPFPSGDVEERQSCEHRVNVFLLDE